MTTSRVFAAAGFNDRSPMFLMTVRYGIDHPRPVDQYHGDEERIRRLLTDVDFTRVISVEILVDHAER